MAPGVPFALLSTVQLLAVAAAVGLAAAGLFPAHRRWSSGLLVTGGLVLAVAHGWAGADLGAPSSAGLTGLRAVGYLCVALGVSSLRRSSLPVVAPLGAPVPPMVLAAGAAAVAALAALRTPRAVRIPLVGALLLSAAAEACAHEAARSAGWAVALLVLRGLSALATFAVVVQLARRSVMAKVATAILAGVLLVAIGTIGIAGAVVPRSLTKDQADQVTRVGAGQAESLEATKRSALQLARVVAVCGGDTSACAEALRQLNPEEKETLAAVVDDKGAVKVLRADFVPALDATAKLDLGQSLLVRTALERGNAYAGFEVLLGAQPRVIAIGVVPRPETRDPKDTDPRDGVRHRGVGLYAVAISTARLRDISQQTDYAATVVVDGVPLASTLAGDELTEVTRIATRRLAGIDFTFVDPGNPRLTVASSEERPTATLIPLRRGSASDVVGVVVLSRAASLVQRTQQDVLRTLFLVTVLVGVLVGLLAIVLGRRIVDPIRRLTAATSRVRRGDLSATADVRAPDEVGALSRAFDAMTSAISRMTGDLRSAAADESALRARLETVLDSMADGLITTDADGSVTSVNSLGVALTGVFDLDASGRPLHEVLIGIDDSGRPLVSPGHPPRSSTGVLEQPGGGRVPVAVVATPLFDGQGWAIVLRDITRERQVERMKTNFLSNVSHELRTPLTPIKGYAEILRRRPDMPADKTEQYADVILDASRRMERVVDLLVAVAALEAGRVSPAPRRVELSDFVSQRLDLWRERAPLHDLRSKVADDLPEVEIDPTWVGKALDELIDNAVKYSEPGSDVTVAAAPVTGANFIRLTVHDAGIGIAPEQLQMLFADFEQLDGSATRTFGGLGLGLSFVRRVVDEFGLAVHVDSIEGTGSAFSIDLPVASPSTTARRPRSPAATGA